MEKKRNGDKILLGIGITLAVILGLILLLPFLMLALILLEGARAEAAAAAPDQLRFINQSNSVICSVALDDTVISEETLEPGDGITVEWETWPTILTVSGEEAVLGQMDIPKEPYQDWTAHCWYIIAQDGPEGFTLTRSHVEELDRVMELAEEWACIELSGGVVTLFETSGSGFNGDGHDFVMMTFSEEDAAALESLMADAKGWHPYEDSELLDRIFFSRSAYCTSDAYAVPRPTEGWYFFRDTYNSQHGPDDENQWSTEGKTGILPNFTAAVYDSGSQTLYIYELDT